MSYSESQDRQQGQPHGQSCLVVMYHYVRDSRTTAFPDIRALARPVLRHRSGMVGVGDDPLRGG